MEEFEREIISKVDSIQVRIMNNFYINNSWDIYFM